MITFLRSCGTLLAGVEPGGFTPIQSEGRIQSLQLQKVRWSVDRQVIWCDCRDRERLKPKTISRQADTRACISRGSPVDDRIADQYRNRRVHASVRCQTKQPCGLRLPRQ